MPQPPIPIPAFLAAPVEALYRAAVARRNRAFDRGARVSRLPVPVISVGNISLGGTGKTPMVMRIVDLLKEAGRRPAIAMRGYGARPGAYSDEQAEYLERFPDVPVVAQPDRLAGLKPIIDSHAADCVVLDDGFQHRFIARDLDIVLIDATSDPFADRCLPAGRLREPVESLRRAGPVVLTHAEAVEPGRIRALSAKIAELTGRAPVATARHAWRELRISRGNAPPTSEPVTRIMRKRMAAACAIGNPDAFLRAAQEAEADLVIIERRRDHHPWTASDVMALRKAMEREGIDAILTTEKDFTKLGRLDLSGLTIIRPLLHLDLGPGEAALRESIRAAIDAAPRHSQG